jgi:hypothetical protein
MESKGSSRPRKVRKSSTRADHFSVLALSEITLKCEGPLPEIERTRGCHSYWRGSRCDEAYHTCRKTAQSKRFYCGKNTLTNQHWKTKELRSTCPPTELYACVRFLFLETWS